MVEDENLNSSPEDSGEKSELPTEETQEETKTSEETQTSEEETPESEEAKTQKRVDDTTGALKEAQAELTKIKQETAGLRKGQEQTLQAEDIQKAEANRLKQLDVGTYMEKYKDDYVRGLNEWMNAREESQSTNVLNTVKPLASQTQYLGWSLMKILKEIAPEAVEKQKELEGKIKKVLEENPSLRYSPNSLDQAEQILLGKMSKKDMKALEKDIEAKVKKSFEQKTGISVPIGKAPPKADKKTATVQGIVNAGVDSRL